MMHNVKSRKHAALRLPRTSLYQAAAMVAGLSLGGPAIADTNDAAGSGADMTQAKSLEAQRVEGNTSTNFKVDQISSPKFTESLLDTPQSITIVSKDLFQQQGATTLTEALRNVPGVGTFYAGENGSTSTGDSIYMRGFDTSSSIFVDGVRDLGTISRDVFNIEQVEVTQGPDGTEYGRTAPTGAINMVTKQPTLHDSISGTYQGGSADRNRGTIDWNHAIGAHTAFRLNVLGQKSGVVNRDDIRNNRWAVAPSFAFGLGTATRVYLDYLHVQQNNVPDGGVPTIGLPGYSSSDTTRPFLSSAARVDPSNYYGTTSDHDKVKQDMFTFIFEHDFNPDLTLRDTARWGRTHQDYLLTSFMGLAADIATPDPADPSTWTIARVLPTFKNQVNTIITNQTNVTANFATGQITHHISAGIELTREKLQTTGEAAIGGTAWPAASIYDPDPNVTGLIYGSNGANGFGKTDTAAAYIFDTLKFGSHWQLNAGIRFDHYTTDYDSTVVCGGRGAPACGSLATGSVVPGVNDRKVGNLLNYKVGLVYKPVSNGSIYADFAISAEPPGGGTMTLSSSANSADNPIFNPERARTYELGTKWELGSGRILLTGALYQTTVTDDVVQGDDGLYYQIGRKRVQGVQLSAVGKITENWQVNAGFTTMNTEISTGPVVAEDGSADLAYTPSKAFTSWTSYRLPFGLTIGGGARFNGEMKRGSDSSIGTPSFVSSYWVVDAMASYPINKSLDLQLNLYNLGNKFYIASINKSGYRYIPGATRSAMVMVNFHF
ncbi:catecholate siderophore receptor Fiu [Frateuria aurantia]